MPRVKHYRYRVEGGLYFPVDMLRYDHSFPSTTEDAIKIATTLRGENRTDEGRMKLVQVDLVAEQRPTGDRWLSFGWKVLEVTPLAW